MHLSCLSRLLAIASMLCIPVSSSAGDAAVEPARVMLVGTFHFANPGLDKVKSRVIDVMTPSNQAHLKRVTAHLAEFQPTDVLIECSRSEQGR